jgi:hypothetical protein
MGTLGKIGGTLAALVVGATALYAIRNTDYFTRTAEDTQISAQKTIASVMPGQPTERVRRITHDLGQRNLDRAVNEVTQWDLRPDSTPLYDKQLAGSHTKNAYRFIEGLEDIADSKWIDTDLPWNLEHYDKAAYALIGLAIGASLLSSKAKKPEPKKE